MKTILKEFDVCYTKTPVEARLAKDGSFITIPSKSEGTVFYLYGACDPRAYAVEFYIKKFDVWAVAEVSAELVDATLKPEDS